MENMLDYFSSNICNNQYDYEPVSAAYAYADPPSQLFVVTYQLKFNMTQPSNLQNHYMLWFYKPIRIQLIFCTEPLQAYVEGFDISVCKITYTGRSLEIWHTEDVLRKRLKYSKRNLQLQVEKYH